MEKVLLLSTRPHGEWVGGGFGPTEALGAAAVADLVLEDATILSPRPV